jgi:hypothetical protein
LSIRSTPALTDRIAVQLSTCDCLWFPGLAGELVTHFRCQQAIGELCGPVYGTYRWITGDPGAPRVLGGSIKLKTGSINVELLPACPALEIDGLILAKAAPGETLELIQAATELIARVDGLSETIGAVAKSIHLIVTERDNDISYSSPAIPFSIFVSVPRPDERDAVVRLAEAIIHEAMHLQLTLIEAVVPLMSRNTTTAYSPWKLEDRPIQGMLHGTYVFGVIFQALESLGKSVPAVEPYSAARRRQIASELDSVDDIRQGLTSHGADLWKLLKSTVSAGDEARRGASVSRSRRSDGLGSGRDAKAFERALATEG